MSPTLPDLSPSPPTVNTLQTKLQYSKGDVGTWFYPLLMTNKYVWEVEWIPEPQPNGVRDTPGSASYDFKLERREKIKAAMSAKAWYLSPDPTMAAIIYATMHMWDVAHFVDISAYSDDGEWHSVDTAPGQSIDTLPFQSVGDVLGGVIFTNVGGRYIGEVTYYDYGTYGNIECQGSGTHWNRIGGATIDLFQQIHLIELHGQTIEARW